MTATRAYPRPVSRLPSRVRRSRRVYYIGAVAMALGLWTGTARGQLLLTAAPSMTKGPATAPVTIIEFSDYQ